MALVVLSGLAWVSPNTTCHSWMMNLGGRRGLVLFMLRERGSDGFVRAAGSRFLGGFRPCRSESPSMESLERDPPLDDEDEFSSSE